MSSIIRTLAIGTSLVHGLYGQSQNPIHINVILREPVVSLGEPIAVLLTALNRGTLAATLDLGLNREGAFRIEVIAPDGTTSQARRPPFPGSESLVRLSYVVVEPGSTYKQTLRLSEWYMFSQVGTYVLNVDMVSPSFPTQKNVFELVVKQRDPESLRAACERLTTAVAEAPYSSPAYEAALELKFVSDPIAVPYLERVFMVSPPFRAVAIEGLQRIGTLEAAEILIRIRNGSYDEEGTLASAALTSLAQTTRDANVLQRLALAGIARK